MLFALAHANKECLDEPIILCNESCKVLVILKQQQDLISSNFRLTCVPFCVHFYVATEKLHTHYFLHLCQIHLVKLIGNLNSIQCVRLSGQFI